MNAEKIALETLPKPKKTRGGQGKLIGITLLAVALVGGAAFWFTRDENTKTQLKTQVQASVQSVVQGTPLEAVTEAVTRIFSPPPPPPVGLSNPSTAPGTLGGQVILGTVPSPVDPGVDTVLGPDGKPLDPNAPESGAPDALPKVVEDTVVRSLFLQDLAQWMVQRYQPGKGGGSVNMGVQSANQRYATSLRGITYRGEDLPSGREALFRYAFTPSMLRALYGLYVDRFVEELGHTAADPAQGKALNAEQIDDMYRAYATRFSALGALLDNISRMPDLRQQIEKFNKNAQKAVEIHSQIAEAVFALDEAREKGNSTQIQTAQLRVDGLNAHYLRAMNERSVAQQALVSSLRGTGGARSMDEDTVLFVGNWIERRMSKQPEAQRTAEVAAQILFDLARRLNQAASVAR